MRILLDSHAFLWFVLRKPQLSNEFPLSVLIRPSISMALPGFGKQKNAVTDFDNRAAMD